MTSEKIKLTGQLIDDPKPVVLAVCSDIWEIRSIVDEYKSVFPDIFLNAEWGHFKIPISIEKARALNNLFNCLNAPLQNVLSSIPKLKK